MKAALRTSVSEEETRHHKHSINPLARAELQNIQSLDNDNDNDNDNDSLPLQRAKSASVVMRMETVAAAVEDMSRRLQELKRLQSLLVHPHGRFMQHWDIVIMVALAFTAFVTPYEIALISTKMSVLFVINRLVDLVFTIDIIVNFRLMYYKDTLLIRDQRRITKKYLQSWFAIDFLSVAPGYIDLYMVAANTTAGMLVDMTFALRLIRLAKMGRILKASRLLTRWRTMINIKNSGMTLLTNTMVTILATHWFACLWLLMLQVQGPKKKSWVNAFVGSSDVCHEQFDYDSSYKDHNNYEYQTCFSPSRLYLLSLYWSVVNLISGYAAWATTVPEYVLSVCAMVIGGFCWLVIGAHITAAVVNEPYDVRLYKDTMDEVNDFLSATKIKDRVFARTLRKYVMFARSKNLDEQNKRLLEKLSPALGGQCAQLGADVILSSNGLRWFRHLATRRSMDMSESNAHSHAHEFSAATLELMLAMDSNVYGANEHIHDDETLFIVCKGVCARNGKILMRGDNWGEDAIFLHNQDNIYVYPGMTITFVLLWSLPRESLDDIREGTTHAVRELLRQYYVRFAVTRGIIMSAKRYREENNIAPVTIPAVVQEARKQQAMIANSKAGRTGRSSSRLTMTELTGISPKQRSRNARASTYHGGGVEMAKRSAQRGGPLAAFASMKSMVRVPTMSRMNDSTRTPEQQQRVRTASSARGSSTWQRSPVNMTSTARMRAGTHVTNSRRANRGGGYDRGQSRRAKLGGDFMAEVRTRLDDMDQKLNEKCDAMFRLLELAHPEAATEAEARAAAAAAAVAAAEEQEQQEEEETAVVVDTAGLSRGVPRVSLGLRPERRAELLPIPSESSFAGGEEKKEEGGRQAGGGGAVTIGGVRVAEI